MFCLLFSTDLCVQGLPAPFFVVRACFDLGPYLLVAFPRWVRPKPLGSNPARPITDHSGCLRYLGEPHIPSKYRGCSSLESRSRELREDLWKLLLMERSLRPVGSDFLSPPPPYIGVAAWGALQWLKSSWCSLVYFEASEEEKAPFSGKRDSKEGKSLL